MNELMDWLDDWILGPLNLIDRLEGLFQSARYRDRGTKIGVLRMDKGGNVTLNEVEAFLRHYGIDVYERTHNSKALFFRVKKRQKGWAEYLLSGEGYKLTTEIDPRNANRSGKRPQAWADRR